MRSKKIRPGDLLVRQEETTNTINVGDACIVTNLVERNGSTFAEVTWMTGNLAGQKDEVLAEDNRVNTIVKAERKK